MSYLEIDSQFRIKTNEAKYSSQGGLLYASCFEYSDVTKSLISNINRKNYVYLDGSKIFIIPNSFEIYSSKVQGTDYFHTIITRKNCVEVDESGDEYIFCIIYGKEVDNTEDYTDKLFEKLNKLSSVPLLREWMPYIINKMTEFGGIFHNCHSNIGFPNCVRIAAVTVYNKWLVSIIQRGLQSGDLTIDNCKKILRQWKIL